MMSVTIQEFYIELYQEFLEEASFLHDQRLSLFNDPEVAWPEIADFEERFEALIDGLVVGDTMALAVCRQQAMAGDTGELHAAVRVFCRQGRLDLLEELISELDQADAGRIQAIGEALQQELPEGWEKDMVQMLAKAEEPAATIAAAVIGYRRIPATTELAAALKKGSHGANDVILWAIGRIRDPSAAGVLLDLVKSDEDLAPEAALALIRMGDIEILNASLQAAGQKQWPVLVLGLCGGPTAVSRLMRKASEKADTDLPLALGLMGDISAIDLLVSFLIREETASNAALALSLITAADVYENVFIPEETDEAELFPEEIQKLRAGEPLHKPGQKPGTTTATLSRNPVVWQGWWAENRNRFVAGVRYRGGRPCSPVSLIESLSSPSSPRLIRPLAYEELVIRYGVDFHFETDLVVDRQNAIIAKYTEWAKSNSPQFSEGQWYYATHPVH